MQQDFISFLEKQRRQQIEHFYQPIKVFKYPSGSNPQDKHRSPINGSISQNQQIGLKNMLNLIDRNLKALTQKQIGKGVNIKHLDASCNQLSRGIDFNPLVNLMTLVIDDNQFSSLSEFPQLVYLQTFSANKNSFSDIANFLQESCTKFPLLKNLSTLKNPLNPFFQGPVKYNIFRDQVLDKFPNLTTLDGCAVVIMKRDKLETEKKEDNMYEKVEAVGAYDAKYMNQEVKNIKTRSVGHRFIRNNQL